MPILFRIILSTLIISLLSLVGIFTLVIKAKLVDRILLLLVGFSAGALVGGAFLHLLPESLESAEPAQTFLYVLVGFVFFFLMERIFYWRHCHEGICNVHTFTYLNLFGDGLHNFMDGLIIAGSFVSSIPLGIATTLAVAFHELPQEIGDFGVLVYGGFSKLKALSYNLLSALLAIVGGVSGYYLSSQVSGFAFLLLPFTAGGFIYIAASDLIPELHKEKVLWKSNLAFLTFLLGIFFMWLTKLLLH